MISLRLSNLVQLTVLSQQHRHKSSSSSKEFDFLVRAFFPEVVEQLDESVGGVFSAGNPDKFFANYQTSMEFLTDFERELGSLEAVNVFRESAAYNSFTGRWNLPIYFQIRFVDDLISLLFISLRSL